MSKYICLVTNELHPITNGGCGTLILNSIYELLSKSFRVLLLADIPAHQLWRFQKTKIQNFPNKNNLKIVSLSELVGSFLTDYAEPAHEAQRQGYRFYSALLKLMETEYIDVIEFPDYYGWAYCTIAHFCCENRNDRPEIIIRFHCSFELIDSVTNTDNYGLHKFITYQLERYSLSRSDQILMPTDSVGKWVNQYYRGSFNYSVSTPSFAAMDIVPHKNKKPNPHIIMLYARLDLLKGVDLFMNAAIRLLNDGIKSKIKFVLAGPDMKQAPGGGSLIKYFENIIPERFRKRFDFPGKIDRNQWRSLLPDVICAVLPSRMETYCYSVREFALAGVPTIVSDIPAFQDLIESGISIPCRLNSFDLSEKIKLLIENKELRQKLSRPWRPPPALGGVYNKTKSNQSDCYNTSKELLDLTLIILKNEDTESCAIDETISNIEKTKHINIWVAVADQNGSNALFGRKCRLIDLNNQPVTDTQNTGSAISFMFAGDIIEPGLLSWCLEMLSKHPDLGFVGAATKSSSPTSSNDFPWDAAPEALPFLHPGHLCRCVFRTPPEPLKEKLDSKLSIFQEVFFIWLAVNQGKKGLRRPNPGIIIADDSDKWMCQDETTINSALHPLLNHFINHESQLRIPEVLKASVHDYCFPVRDLLESIKRGQTLEVGGIRLNLKNLIRLLIARIKSMA